MNLLRYCLIAIGPVVILIPVKVFAFAYLSQVGTSQSPPVSNQSFGDPVIWRDPNIMITLDFESDFNTSAEAAMQEWDAVGSPLQLSVGLTPAQPCDNDRINAAGWGTMTCDGQQFGDALAVTRRNFIYNTASNTWEITDADIIVDQSQNWFAHLSGTLPLGTQDFHRVILHELGHTFGLEHPDEAGQQVEAIMNSSVSNIDTLQDDDKQGIIRLYGINSSTSNSGNNSTAANTHSGGGDNSGLTYMLLGYWLPRFMRSLFIHEGENI